MGLADSYVPTRVTGDGATVVFTGTWPIFNATYLKLFSELKTTGVLTPLVKDTDYSLTFDDTGWSADFTISAPPASTVFVVGQRITAQEQTTPYKTSSGFDGSTTETSFDILTAMVQEAQDQLDRAPLSPVGSTLTLALPSTAVDGFGLVWDGTGGTIRNTTASLEDLETNAAVVTANITNVNLVGNDIANVNTVAADGADIGTVAGISANVTTVAGISANVTTVAGISANVTTVAGISTDVTTVAGISTEVTEAAANLVAATKWTYDDTTAMADPTTGLLRLNNATEASVTAIAIDDLTAQTGNPDLSAYIITWDDSDSTLKGSLKLTKSDDATIFAIYDITGLTDNSGWTELAVTYVTGAGSFTDADTMFVSFDRTGDKGTTGSVGTITDDIDMNGNQMQLSKGADVASATALPIITDGNFFNVTGTATVTSFDTTGTVGTPYVTQFDDALILTHHATDLILPGGANITTAAGDVAHWIEYAAGDVICTSYTKADGTPVVPAGDGIPNGGYAAGSYYNGFMPESDGGGDALSADVLYAFPFAISETNTFDRFRFQVQATGTATAARV
ncbi:MAG: hypothetical protein V3U75_13320, partial [Methylococcaceae bacterium]